MFRLLAMTLFLLTLAGSASAYPNCTTYTVRQPDGRVVTCRVCCDGYVINGNRDCTSDCR